MEINKKKMLVAASIAGIIAAGASFVTQNAQAEEGVACYGMNACKGTGECGGKGHSCAGKNACKGAGWVKTADAATCTDQGGSTTEKA